MKNIVGLTNAPRVKNRPDLLSKGLGFLFAFLVLGTVPALADITTGLVGYWSMDNADINWTNNTIIDRSGNGNTGTLVGFTSASSVTGKYGTALQFNGTSNYITFANSQDFNSSLTNAFTYSAWINMTVLPSSTNGGDVILSKKDYTAGTMGYWVGLQLIYKNGARLVCGGTVGSNLQIGNAPLLSTAGQWVHLVATYDGTTETIYLNGASQASLQAAGIVAQDSSLVIGANTRYGQAYFNGAMQEVRVYGRALSASDVQELYQQTGFSYSPFPVPAAPTGFISTDSTANSVSLAWTASTDPNTANYKLYESGVVLAAAFENAFPSPPNGPSEPTYGVNILNWLQAYNYVDGNGFVMADLTSPAVLNALQAEFTGPAELPGGLTEYQAILGILQNPPPVLIAVIPAGSTSFQVSNLAPGIAYSFQLSAISPAYFESSPTSALPVSTQAGPSSSVTPEQYLPLLTQPVFKPGYTLPPLTRYGWQLDYNTDVELAQSWGYGLEFGSASASAISSLSDPRSTQAMDVALANSNPSVYKLFATVPPILGAQVPSSAYDVDANGGLTTSFSPQAPGSALEGMAADTTSILQQLTSKAPVSVLLNGGERYLAVPGQGESYWAADPNVTAAVQALYGTSNPADVPWEDYASQQKQYQEAFFTNAIRSLTNALYVYYPIGNQYYPSTGSDWDYKWMNTIANYPSGSYYWLQYNSGWQGHLNNNNDDLLSQGLNAYGYDSTFGKTLSYNWVNNGWGGDDGDPTEGFGDMPRYYGYLKSYYTAGMIGGIAGYFDYPTGGFGAAFNSNAPPQWLLQIIALGQVHAEFSFFEDMLRNGVLLPGPDMNPSNPAEPAYEFRTGYTDTRVLARKMNGQERWLISAWAADGVTRTVNVAIPVLGTVSVTAKPAGSIYDGRIVGGDQYLTMLDGGSETPTPLLAALPTSIPDSDPAPPAVSLTTDHPVYTVRSTVNLSATAVAATGANITSVAFYNNNGSSPSFTSTLLGTSTSPTTSGGNVYTYAWNAVTEGNDSLTAIATDSNGNTTTSSVASIMAGYPLSVSNAGNGYGETSSSDGNINCGADLSPDNCSETANVGNIIVTLTATPASGSSFTGWSGGGCSGTGTCVVTMNSAQTVTATFTGTAAINYGDVNGAVNGSGQPVVTIADAEMAAQASVGLITLTSTQQQAAEVDGTGKPDIYDAYLIAEYAVGLITQFPVQGG